MSRILLYILDTPLLQIGCTKSIGKTFCYIDIITKMVYAVLEVITDGQRRQEKSFNFDTGGSIPATGGTGGVFLTISFILYQAGFEMASIISESISISIERLRACPNGQAPKSFFFRFLFSFQRKSKALELTSGTRTPDYRGTRRRRPGRPGPPAAGTPRRPAACARTSCGSRSRRS